MVARGPDPSIEHGRFTDLPAVLDAGDVLVVNRSATLPASLRGDHRCGRAGRAAPLDPAARRAVGRRAAPPRRAGQPAVARRGAGHACCTSPAAAPPSCWCPRPARSSPARPVRLWVARGVDLPGGVLAYLARHGRPIRYRYVDHDRPIGAYQTVFADVPGSAEMPSAARPFSAELVTRLVARGVMFAPFVLHCGVSSPEAHEPPMAEWYSVPRSSAATVNAARAAGHRVVAVGTTAVRALETVVDGRGRVHPGEGWTEVVVTPDRRVRSVDGLITGWHEPEASHLAMLEAIAGHDLLVASYRAALEEGYLWHEFGDSHLILP